MLARLSTISTAGGGMVLVSAKQPGRWTRYGFAILTLNTLTGSTVLGREVPGCDGAWQ